MNGDGRLDIKHFGWVEPWLARGGQPAPEQYEHLAALGIDTLVNLRFRDDSKRIETTAPRVLHVRITVRNDRAPSQEQALKWLRFCADVREERKVFVHCKNGRGRTSVFCVLVRIAQGWDVERAIDEERKYGFGAPAHEEQMAFLRELYASVRAGRIEIPQL